MREYTLTEILEELDFEDLEASDIEELIDEWEEQVIE